MLIIPYVCADFRDKSGKPIFRITAGMLRTMVDVPEAIKQDLLFDMLVADGSIKTPETAAQRKLLEQEPGLGMLADGKEAKAERTAKAAKTETKAEEKHAEGGKPAAAETKPDKK